MLPLHQPPKVPCLNLLATPQFYNPKCFDENGRGGGIRTPDFLLPKQTDYQTVLHPEMALPLGLEPRTYGLTDRRYQPAELREHKERRIERRKKKNVMKN